MDIYTTAVLQAVVDSLKRPQTFLLDMFFTMVSQSNVEEIKFDVGDGKRRIAPFVSPLIQGKLVESLGYQTKTFKPAYVKDKRVIDPEKPLKRMIGENIAGSMAPQNRESAIIANELQDQVDMLQRRFEVMASEAMREGQVTVEGEGYDTVVVDFGRDANLEVTLLTTDRWGETDVLPHEDLEEWALDVQQIEGAVVTDIVMDPLSFKLARANSEFRALLDNRRMEGAGISSVFLTGDSTGQLKGTIGNWRIWVYQDWYIDDAGVEQQIMPDYTVLLVARNQLLGTRHFGAIRDAELGYQATEFAPKSWVEKDPAVRYLLMQSAPLIVPYRPNAVLRAKVR